MVLGDFGAYAACQESVDTAFRDRARWTRMALCNIARMGFFSSDRSVREYAEKIWNVTPVPVSPITP